MKTSTKLIIVLSFFAATINAQGPTITSFSPASGAVGTLVTITGTGLTSPTAFTIGGINAVVVSYSTTQAVGLVMPGAVTGLVTFATPNGTGISAGIFTVTSTPYPGFQQGNKLTGTGELCAGNYGYSAAVSSDGNTAIVGGDYDSCGVGGAWVYVRSGGAWTQQGKLKGTGAVGLSYQGSSVAISADGNTAIVGGYHDNSLVGAAWVYVRAGGTWSQEGNKLVGTGAIGNAEQGMSVSISADGNTAVVGGWYDNSNVGAAWVFTRSGETRTSGGVTGGTWTQSGSKLVGTGSIPGSSGVYQGCSSSISSDGTTVIVGGQYDNSGAGAAWVYGWNGASWIQQGNKLVGTGAIGTIVEQGNSVSLSADGNTAIVGGEGDNTNSGAFWIYTRSGGVWTQQGNKLIGSGATGAAAQGQSVSLSADGNTALIGGYEDNNYAGAMWVYTRAGGVWTQQGNKLVGTGASGAAYQGTRVSISSDGTTAISGGFQDNGNSGAAWVYTVAAPVITSISPSSGPPGTLFTVNGTNLGSPTLFTVGSPAVNALVISNTGTQLVGLVMPGSVKGKVLISTGSGTDTSSVPFIVKPTPYPSFQQGNKLRGTSDTVSANQGAAVAISSDGNTAIVGGYGASSGVGAVWFYTRSAGVWTQQGVQLTGTGASGSAEQAYSVAISADGNTAVAGGYFDNSGIGAAWVYTRSGVVWSQQGNKLVGTGDTGTTIYQGIAVSISADGNTIVVGGQMENSGAGAVWVYSRSGGVWSQSGNKLLGSGTSGSANLGHSVAISSDASTIIAGGWYDNSNAGAAWIYTQSGGVWKQQGNKLVGTGSFSGAAFQGSSVALSSDGNTALVGGSGDSSNLGAVWIFTRSGGVWTQQGTKLKAAGPHSGAEQGISVAISADGNTAMVGGSGENTNAGATWVYTRSGGVWTQRGGRLSGMGAIGAQVYQGRSVSISTDGNTSIIGGSGDNTNTGAAWVFVPQICTLTVNINSTSPTCGKANGQLSLNITGGTAGFSYVWSNSSTTSTISGLPAGSYTVTVTDSKGCVTTASSTLTNSSSGISVSIGSPVNVTCNGGNNGSAVATVSGGVPPYSFNWSNGASGPTVTGLLAGSYSVTATDAGCTSSVSVSITQPLAISISAPAITNASCTSSKDGSVSITSVSGGRSPYTYSWSNGGTSLNATGLSAKTYTLAISDTSGCFASFTVPVSANKPNYNLAFNANPQTGPAPLSVALNNTTPSLNSYNFTWYTGDGMTNASNSATHFYTYQFAGTYDVVLIATDKANGCTDTLTQPGYILATGTACTQTATVSPSGPVTSCTGDTVILSANTGAGFTYNWNINNMQITGATGSKFAVTQNGYYSVTILKNNCPVTSSAVQVSFVNPPATPTIGSAGSMTPCVGGTVTLTSSAISGGTYLWTTGATTQSISVTKSGNFQVVVKNSSGCRSDSSAVFSVNTALTALNICMVTVDDSSKHNLIVWDKPLVGTIDSFIVYREITTNNYKQIGALPYSALSEFLDTVRTKYFPFTGDPNSGAYRYKIGIRDTCGNYSPLSPYHNTIYSVQATPGVFTWNQYEIEGQPLPVPTLSSYVLYRDDNNTGIFSAVSGVAGSQTTVADAAYLSYPNGRWIVETSWGITCNPSLRTEQSATVNTSRSNIKNNLNVSTGIQGNGSFIFAAWPNPASKQLTVEYPSGFRNYRISIFNLLGAELYVRELSGPGAQNAGSAASTAGGGLNAIAGGKNTEQIDVSGFAAGLYTISIQTETGKVFKKLVVQ